MKCPKCSYNQKVKFGLTCGSCKYKFAFNPKEKPYLSDGKFNAILRKASADGSQYFTLNQLYFAYCRFMAKKTKSLLGCSTVAMVISIILAGIYLATDAGVAFGFGVFSGFVALVTFLAWLSSRKPHLKTAEDFKKGALQRWEKLRGPLEKLVREPRLHQPPDNGQFSDLYDYGVSRLLIVQHDILVDLFVLNRWHVAQQALVIAESGYPTYLRDLAKEALARQPDLPIFLLHDASPEGLGMMGRVQRDPRLPVKGHPIVDMGLFEADAQKIKKLGPAGAQGRTPVDAMPFGMMAAGASAAVLGGFAFSEILAQQSGASSAASMGGASFDFG